MMMRTTALVALAALVMLGSPSVSQAGYTWDEYPEEVIEIGDLAGSGLARAVTGGDCVQNAPEGVNPRDVIVSRFTCYSCVGSQTIFNFESDALINENKVGCACEDLSPCVSWDATPTWVLVEPTGDD
jgi:hypothetical protein